MSSNSGGDDFSDWEIDPDIVSYRFRKAFPQLGSGLAWLSAGYKAGASWHPLLERYASGLSHQQAMRLGVEIRHVFKLGLKTDHHAEVLVRDVLGWQSTEFPVDAPDPLALLVQIAERVETV